MNSSLPFQLHPTLKQDCFEIEITKDIHILGLNNCHYPWFLLVPQTPIKEFYQLPQALKDAILGLSDQVSEFFINKLHCEKINIASIGNIVDQLHFHVIGRKSNDPAWPGVVWGHGARQLYSPEQKQKIISQWKDYLGP